jgi:hypothetical protein
MQGVQETVLTEFHRNIGLQLTTSELERLLPRFSRRQIQNAMYQLGKKGLIRQVTSTVYVYDAQENGHDKEEKKSSSDHVYENVGTLADGTPIVRSEEGQLFVIQTLEAYFTK